MSRGNGDGSDLGLAAGQAIDGLRKFESLLDGSLAAGAPVGAAITIKSSGNIAGGHAFMDTPLQERRHQGIRPHALCNVRHSAELQLFPSLAQDSARCAQLYVIAVCI